MPEEQLDPRRKEEIFKEIEKFLGEQVERDKKIIIINGVKKVKPKTNKAVFLLMVKAGIYTMRDVKDRVGYEFGTTKGLCGVVTDNNHLLKFKKKSDDNPSLLWLTELVKKIGKSMSSSGKETGGERRSQQRKIRSKKRFTYDEKKLDKGFIEEDLPETTVPEKEKKKWVEIKKRNGKAVKKLKELYEGKCQISGEEGFKTKKGSYYCEVHHLIPLGENGADKIFNMIVVSPLIHRMLHYAENDAGDIDLKKLQKTESGEMSQKIEINKKEYTIKWKEEHGKKNMQA